MHYAVTLNEPIGRIRHITFPLVLEKDEGTFWLFSVALDSPPPLMDLLQALSTASSSPLCMS